MNLHEYEKATNIFFLLTINITVFGQHDFGFIINAGVSKISNSFRPSSSTLSTNLAPSGNLGLFYNFNFNKSKFGCELFFSQIEGYEIMEFDTYDQNGNNNGFVRDKLYSHLSYLSFPIYFGYSINKLSLSLGFQFSFVLHKSAKETG